MIGDELFRRGAELLILGPILKIWDATFVFDFSFSFSKNIIFGRLIGLPACLDGHMEQNFASGTSGRSQIIIASLFMKKT